MFQNIDVVEILKVGLPGLVFLLSLSAFILIQKEQKKDPPRNSILKSIKMYMYFSLVFAVLTIIAPFLGGHEHSTIVDVPIDVSSANVGKGIAAGCISSNYYNRFILIRNVETNSMVQVHVRNAVPCGKNEKILISNEDAIKVNLNASTSGEKFEIDAAVEGYEFI